VPLLSALVLAFKKNACLSVSMRCTEAHSCRKVQLAHNAFGSDTFSSISIVRFSLFISVLKSTLVKQTVVVFTVL